MSDFLTLKGGEVDVGGAPEVISVLPFGHVAVSYTHLRAHET